MTALTSKLCVLCFLPGLYYAENKYGYFRLSAANEKIKQIYFRNNRVKAHIL